MRTSITTLAHLQQRLQTAIELELFLIPPYLCAEWSLKTGANPVGSALRQAISRRMWRLGLLANILTATGGTPVFTRVPSYPGPLPGGVHPGLTVVLRPIGWDAIALFLQLETPPPNSRIAAFPPPPLPPPPPSLRDFHATIAQALERLFPGGLPSRPQPVAQFDGREISPILTVDDALDALAHMNEESQYLDFSQIHFGKTLVSVGPESAYVGEPIAMPAAHPFAEKPEANQAQFINTFSTLLTQLDDIWATAADLQPVFQTMRDLKAAGVALIGRRAQPHFRFEAWRKAPARQALPAAHA